MTEAIKILKNGGVGVVPTDTLYGLCASVFSRAAVERIYDLKSRTETKPFIILIASSHDLAAFGITLSTDECTFLDTVWPGPVSVILPCKLEKFEYVHRGTQSLAFRMPKSPKLHEFLSKTGPLVAPSANPQGLAPAHTIAEAKKYFGDAVDFYIPGGRKEGKPSKIVSLVSGTPVVVRA